MSWTKLGQGQVQGHSRSKKVKVKSTFLAIFQWILMVLTPNKSHWVCLNEPQLQRSRSEVKVIQDHPRSRSNRPFGHIFISIYRIVSEQKPLWLYQCTPPPKVKVRGQGQSRSWSNWHFDHISVNIDCIDSKQKPLGLYEWTAPPKVKVRGQGHPRSSKVKVKSTFLAIFQWILIALTPNKSH